MKFVFGLLATVFIWAVALTPTWIFLGARFIVNPEGFWQNLALFGIGFWVLGGFQIILLVTGAAVTVVALLAISEW